MMIESVVRRALDRFVGIDARRKLPPIASQTFESWFDAQTHVGQRPHGRTGKVVLFHDTFINFNYPDIGKADDPASGSRGI